MHFAPKCASFNSSSQLPGHPSSTLSDFLLPVGEEREIVEMKTDRRKETRGTDDVIGQNHSSIVQEVTFSESDRSEG